MLGSDTETEHEPDTESDNEPPPPLVSESGEDDDDETESEWESTTLPLTPPSSDDDVSDDDFWAPLNPVEPAIDQADPADVAPVEHDPAPAAQPQPAIPFGTAANPQAWQNQMEQSMREVQAQSGYPATPSRNPWGDNR